MAGDLKSHNDVERESEAALSVLVRSHLADSTYLRPLIAVLGSGGAGKTTIASRVGHDLAESREAVVFRLKAEELWNRDDLIELTKKCNAPVVFVVDGLEVHSRFKAVKELRHDLSVARARALIVVSCQKAVWHGYETRHPPVEVRTFDVSDRLSLNEAEALVSKLSSVGLIATHSVSEVRQVATDVVEGLAARGESPRQRT